MSIPQPDDGIKEGDSVIGTDDSIDPAAMERAAGVLLHILQIPGR